MADPIVLVPMEVSALSANAYVLQNQPFRRWEETYGNIAQFDSAEPGPTDVTGGFGSSSTGVYLHWKLPDAWTHGCQQPDSQQVEYPLTPNRWLIVRLSGPLAARTASAFVVESDAPGTADSSVWLFDPDIVSAWEGSADPLRQQAGSALSGAGPFITGMLGRSFQLADWKEQGIEQLFVTAVAPGNHLFNAYQSHCRQVFSFYDALADVTEPDSTLSYLVAGWYSNSASDPVASCLNGQTGDEAEQLLSALLSDYGWSLDRAEGDPLPTGTVCHGMVYGVDWQPQGTMQTVKDRFTAAGGSISVAVGNTSIDAFAAMIGQQLQSLSAEGNAEAAQILAEQPNAAALLEAFQYNLLHLADSGDWAGLDYRIRQEWFGSKAGGYRWTIVDIAASDSGTGEGVHDESWLTGLNADQAAFDAARLQLHDAQWELYATWWKEGRFATYPGFAQPSGVTQDQFAMALAAENDPSYNPDQPPGPANIYSVPKKVLDLANLLSGTLAPKVPQPVYADAATTPDDAFQAGIAVFEQQLRAQGLLAQNRGLKAAAEPRFWQAQDPVVLISGAGNTAEIPQAGSQLPCRMTAQTIAGLQNGGTVIPASSIAGLPAFPASAGNLAEMLQGAYSSADFAAAVSAAAGALFTEWLLCDPDNAASISVTYPAFTRERLAEHNPSDFEGGLPALLPEQWSQPWNPFMLKWVAQWYPLPSGGSNWTFQGTDYAYTGGSQKLTPQAIGGDCLLTPQTAFLFKNRLMQAAAASGDPADASLGQLADLIGEAEQWDFISQRLSGFGDQLSLRDSRTNQAPAADVAFTFDDGTTHTLAELTGNQFDSLPLILDTGGTTPFQAVRQGQFCFSYLALYDAFGQVLEVVGDSGLTSSSLFAPVVAEGLKPDTPVVQANPQRFLQLPPRLLQPSRLDFRMVDANNPDQPTDLDSGANPVAGWLIANHLDGSVAIYGANGDAIGAVSQKIGAHGAPILSLAFAPDGGYQSLAELTEASPQLAAMLQGLLAQSAAAFEDFLEAIDNTLWTVDPASVGLDESLGILSGKPLALVRAGMQLSLADQPLGDTSWAATFYPPVPDFVVQPFEVRLGDSALREDGLVGYFLNGSFDSFYCVQPPAEADGYLIAIGQGQYIPLRFDGKTSADLLMLVDPMSAVHAFTGILPAQPVKLDRRFFDTALDRLSVRLPVGPMLTAVGPNPQPISAPSMPASAVKIPVPVERGSSWTWMELAAADEVTIQRLAVTDTDGRAVIDGSDRSLREGQMVVQLKKEEEKHERK
ncbi:hypothetical protein PC41400_10495 [Paenibacillus chitinolyticus]|uniref:Uncharacterized protein n=1 Tax=Paenibacillus chitinolyticus TaxID=79263 RepID=A0A410WUS3_9BACL|nr:hypothetical protein [Paenibacillus chitinolyticus]MCY9593036.1 hypothetical protein [Paenibacillus chitinolyticus]MCY9595212.1 hypothetical protein [Paenibacillus chitinolyticus]QAV18071.1 hypothetical protein PC41400_10495 [Paenibacillus chitinolyticus]